ncbi:hypothetical protein HFO32_22045 [Rhizobium leguminosarum]|uniref:hypothetical protein n=1 Tax=Rhizobium leguminosarum TaxID=384 RepID=UPI001C969862|nr:hypothetical protein [Rhizobium leguminosarum]MBY5684807.1 hypothetical protein [Rhizobium leguminosarum]
MIKQVMMGPSKALHHWAVSKMTIGNVLSQTGYSNIQALHAEYAYELAAEEMAREDMMMSPAERQHEADVEEVWEQFSDFLKEMVPPAEYDLEIERLLPLVQMRQQAQRTAAASSFNRRQ